MLFWSWQAWQTWWAKCIERSILSKEAVVNTTRYKKSLLVVPRLFVSSRVGTEGLRDRPSLSRTSSPNTGWSFASVTCNTVLRGPIFDFFFFPIWFLVTTHWEVLIFVCTFRLSITCCYWTLGLPKWNFGQIQHIMIKMVSLYNQNTIFPSMLMEYVMNIILCWVVIVMVIFIHFKTHTW